MSLGHYSPRGQRMILAAMFLGAATLALYPTRGALVTGAVLAMYETFEVGRSFEAERMRKRKWYREENYDQIE